MKGNAGEGAVGFAVVYRWKLKVGREDQFCKGWKTVTEILRDKWGALGSRLHRGEDGTWVAYAQWPDRSAWESSEVVGDKGLAAMKMMQDAVEERFSPMPLVPVHDLLVRGS